MKKTILFLTVWLMSLHFAFAQNIVSGSITNSTTGEPMEGVTVIANGTTVGALTDVSGKYQLNVPAGTEELLITFIGYKKVLENISGRKVIDVSMEEDVLELEEVLVTANAIVREKKELGYAVGQVDNSDLTKARETNVLNSLAGKVAGVRVTSQSGSVGGGTKVLIRGNATIEPSGGTGQPLFVVDGIPISNSGFNGTRSDIINGGVDVGNRAGDLNPDDIESMTVLKGAAATALYGARARDGAIIITTKRGTRNSRAQVSFNSSLRFDQVLKLPEFQNEYALGDRGEYDITQNNLNGWGPKISEVQDQQFEDFTGEMVTLQAYPDNVKDFYETGITRINSFSFADGSEEGDFRLGYTNLNQTGTVPGSELKRNTLAFNAGRDVGSHITARVSANYVRSTSAGRPAQGSNSPNVLPSLVNGIPRHFDIQKLADNVVDEAGKPIGMDGITNNPYWIVQNNIFSNRVERFYGMAELQYDPTSWLNITGRVGSDVSNENRQFITRKGTIGGADGAFDTREIYLRQINTDLIATITKDISSDVGLRVILGHNTNERFRDWTRVVSGSLASDGLYNPANAASNAVTNAKRHQRIIGAYADVTLDYKNWAFLNVTGRNDWNSTLSPDNRSYFYPSVSGSFVFTEAFDISNKFLTYGKLRGNYAEVGSSVGPYLLDFTFLPDATLFTQFFAVNNTYPHGGALSFSATNIIPEPNLRPQRQNSWEIGTELIFADGLIRLDATYYSSVTTDQIVNIEIPQSTGFAAKTINAGTVSNKGIEAFMTISPFRPKNAGGFRWDMTLNFARNVNKVEELTEGLEVFTITSGFSGIQIQAAPGEPFGLWGGAWARDTVSGLPIINPQTGLRQPGQAKNLGNIYPDWTLGIGNEFSWKGFNLSFLVDIREGGVIFSNTTSGLRFSGLAIETAENRGQVFIDKGVIQNPDGSFRPNDVPVESMQDFWTNYSTTSVAESSIFDASYVKLREVRLGYTIPKSILENTPFGTINIAFEGRNLWIIQDHVPHIDPEVNFFGSSLIGEGVEFNSVPSNRSFGVNLRLSF